MLLSIPEQRGIYFRSENLWENLCYRNIMEQQLLAEQAQISMFSVHKVEISQQCTDTSANYHNNEKVPFFLINIPQVIMIIVKS